MNKTEDRIPFTTIPVRFVGAETYAYHASRLLFCILLLFLFLAVPAYAATNIYRSVAPGATSALATGTANALTISGSTATFTTALDNNIGVGDVIAYDTNNDLTPDAVVFIHGRTDATHYTVKTAAGATPTQPAAIDSSWSLYRAYTALGDAVVGTENTSVAFLLRNFDTFVDCKNLIDADEAWHIVCYANGITPDTAQVVINNDWSTSSTCYLNIYTPTASNEVGVSQRHSGIWDSGKYNLVFDSDDSWQAVIECGAKFLRIDGLQIRMVTSAATGNYPTIFYDLVDDLNSDMRISNNIICADFSGLTGTNNGWGLRPSPWGIQSTKKLWNNIIYGISSSNSATASKVIQFDAGVLYAYNNTIVDCDQVFRNNGGSPEYYLFNNIVQGCDGCYWEYNSLSDYNISDIEDDITEGAHDKIATVRFVDAANKNYHLASNDTAARDAGINLSADLTISFSLDIDHEARPRGVTWDIGADEGASAHAALKNCKITNAKI